MHLKSDGFTFQWPVYLFCLICLHAAAIAGGAVGLTFPPVPPHASAARQPASGLSLPTVGGISTGAPVQAFASPLAVKPERLPAVRFTFTVLAVAHPSGIFQVHQSGTVNLLIRNKTASPLVLRGHLFWKCLPDSISQVASDGPSPAAVPTAIRPTPIMRGNMMQILLPVRFPATGHYVLFWRHRGIVRRISPPFSVILQPHGNSLPVADSHWISSIPDPFYKTVSVGYISDYMRQTGIRRFLAEISIGDPSVAAPAIPNSTKRLIRIAQVIHNLGGQVVVRLNLFCKNRYWPANRQWLAASLVPILNQLSPDISAMVVNPIGLNVPSRVALALRGVQLAAAQRVYRNIVRMAAKLLPTVPVVPQLKSLGADSYCPLDPQLFSESSVKNLKTKSLIFAVSDNRRWLAFMHTVGRWAYPPVIWVLPKSAASVGGISQEIRRGTQPHRSMGAALALAAGATLGPAREGIRFSAAAHWLGDAVRFAPVHSHLPPSMTVFQANQRAVAIVTGLGAGTIHDSLWRAWQGGHVQWRRVGPSSGEGTNSAWHHLSAGRFPAGHLTIYDPESVLQSFNASGQKLPALFPGEPHIPLNAQFYFVTAPGSARNLVAALRTAEIHGFPPALIFPELPAVRKAAGLPSQGGKIFQRNPPGTHVPIAIGIIRQPSDGVHAIHIRWIIRNAGVGRLDGQFRTSILAENEDANRPELRPVAPVAQAVGVWLEIPSGQFRTLSIAIPNNLSGTSLILRASFHGASFQERVTLPLTAIDRLPERAIGNRTDVQK